MSSYGRAAQRAARQLFSAVKGASEMGSMRGASMASSVSAANSARAAPCMSSSTASVLSSWRSQCQLAGLKPAVSMPFAASAPAASAMPPMNKASCVQVRAVSSGDATDEGDGADEGTTSNSRSTKAPPDGGDDDDENRTSSRLLDDIDDGEDEEGLGAAGPGDAALDSVLERLYGLGAASKDVDRKAGVNMEMYARQDNEDPLGLLVIAKESFMGKDQNALPIPPTVREAMYQHRWDKLLVDVRRTVDLTRRGKREQYTSMVAVGNLNGLFGLGIGTADTAQLSVARAYLDSYTNLTYVPLYRGHTVFHTIDHEFHRLKMRIMPRPAGFGLVCGPLVYELCNLIGLRNATIKVLGRRKNKFFVAKALQEALQKQSTPYDGVEATGMYIREVYHRRKLPAGLVRGVDVM